MNNKVVIIGAICLPLLFSIGMVMLRGFAFIVGRDEDGKAFGKFARYGVYVFTILISIFLLCSCSMRVHVQGVEVRQPKEVKCEDILHAVGGAVIGFTVAKHWDSPKNRQAVKTLLKKP